MVHNALPVSAAVVVSPTLASVLSVSLNRRNWYYLRSFWCPRLQPLWSGVICTCFVLRIFVALHMWSTYTSAKYTPRYSRQLRVGERATISTTTMAGKLSVKIRHHKTKQIDTYLIGYFSDSHADWWVEKPQWLRTIYSGAIIFFNISYIHQVISSKRLIFLIQKGAFFTRTKFRTLNQMQMNGCIVGHTEARFFIYCNVEISLYLKWAVSLPISIRVLITGAMTVHGYCYEIELFGTVHISR